MNKRKIAGCVNVRIRTGDFQHIEVVKYAEEEIEYSSKEELISKEDDLNNDLIECVLRSLKSTAERTGKGKAEAIEVEQRLSKVIPEWLANDPIPNIANGAKKVLNTVSTKQKAEKDKEELAEKDLIDGEITLTGSNNQEDKDKKKKFNQYVKDVKDANTAIDVKDAKDDVGDLFEEDNKTEKTEKTVIPKSDKSDKSDVNKEDDGFDLFGDSEDLFGDVDK